MSYTVLRCPLLTNHNASCCIQINICCSCCMSTMHIRVRTLATYGRISEFAQRHRNVPRNNGRQQAPHMLGSETRAYLLCARFWIRSNKPETRVPWTFISESQRREVFRLVAKHWKQSDSGGVSVTYRYCDIRVKGPVSACLSVWDSIQTVTFFRSEWSQTHRLWVRLEKVDFGWGGSFSPCGRRSSDSDTVTWHGTVRGWHSPVQARDHSTRLRCDEGGELVLLSRVLQQQRNGIAYARRLATFQW